MNTNRSSSARRGTTLVEVLMATLVLGVLILAGGAHLHFARAAVYIQADRERALETVTGRLEALRAERLSLIAPPDPSTYYLAPSGTAWSITVDDPGETVDLGAFQAPLRTRVRWEDFVPGTVTQNYIRVTVEVAYRKGSDDLVQIQSMLAP